ncbi:glycine cleavage system protein GcvH [bacterium]|nr:glycine cleavage system protein GcvH [bacterium]
MNFPEDLLYSTSHEWIKLNGDEATIGITEYAQSELGDIIFVETPEVGRKIQPGQPFGSIEAVKTVSDLYGPLTGEVTDVNSKLTDTPEVINSDPYGEGWIIKMKVTDASAKAQLLSVQKYKETTAH